MILQYIFIAFTRIISFINSIYAYRLLPTENIGMSTLLQASSAHISVFVDLGLNEYATREAQNHKIKEIISTILYFRIIVSIILLTCTFIFVTIFDYGTLNYFVMLVIFLLILRSSTETLFIYRTIGRLTEYYLLLLSGPVIIAVMYFLLLDDLKKIAAIELFLLAFVNTMVNGLLIMRVRKYLTLSFRWQSVATYIFGNWKLSLAAFLNVTITSSLVYYVSYLFDFEILGLMRVSLLFVLPFELVYFTLMNYYMKELFECDTRKKRFLFLKKYFSKALPLVLLMFICLLGIYNTSLLSVLGLNEKISLDFMAIMIVSKILMVGFLPFIVIPFADNRNNLPLFNSVFSGFLVFVFAFLLIKQYNLVGLAVTNLVLDLSSCVLGFFYFYKKRG